MRNYLKGGGKASSHVTVSYTHLDVYKRQPLDDLEQGVKVKSVFCFVIAPEMRRQGIAALLLEHVCREAAQEGFDVVEAYPWKQWDFGGYYEMYKNSGFTVVQETESGYVMRRQLKHPSQNGRV